jgi:hypothetical protein
MLASYVRFLLIPHYCRKSTLMLKNNFFLKTKIKLYKSPTFEVVVEIGVGGAA